MGAPALLIPDGSPAMKTTATAGPAEFLQPAGRAQTLVERIAATDEWLKNTPRTRYFIQLLSTDANNLSDVQLLVSELAARLDPQQIRVYRSRQGGNDRLGVIYGDYATRGAAQAGLAELSRITPAGTPIIRTVGRLR